MERAFLAKEVVRDDIPAVPATELEHVHRNADSAMEVACLSGPQNPAFVALARARHGTRPAENAMARGISCQLSLSPAGIARPLEAFQILATDVIAVGASSSSARSVTVQAGSSSRIEAT
ncbi:MAG: hypothetical protein JWM11_7370 [Planctomycetaceae bacterium]|nr:hypothetical protein [Planctomycetaceae bacterium]